MQAQYPSRCFECYGTIKVGDPISKDGGRWIHEKCVERATEQQRIMMIAQAVHRESVEMAEMTYSVNYSRGSAMKYALENGVITQGEYDLVRESRDYRLLWNHVSD